MIKIVALNNDGPEEVSEEEVELTKEAQETVVEAEYVRAIKLNSKGKIDLCLQLLEDLLKTQVLNENLPGSSNDKLGVIKYNSHKHIAALLEEKGHDELALQHYILAVLIDDTDVFTLHKFGQLALKLGVLDLAEYAFETCLVRNSTHWLAEEGMLQTLCRRINMLGAFNWATKMLHQNPHSDNALQVYQEIASIFKGRLLGYDTSCLPIIGTHLLDYEMLKPAPLRIENPNDDAENSVVKLQSHKTKILNWLSIGQFIKDTYSERKSSFFMFNLEDILLSEPMNVDHQGDVLSDVHCISSDAPKVALLAQTSVQVNEIELDDAVSEQFDIQITNDNNNDDSDSNAKSDGCETNKTKPIRRRCSDLHFLEQWGWHKSRRYASRKKPERDEIDVSLNNYLRKLFSKHTKEISLNNWPFRDSPEEIGKQITAFGCSHCCIVYTKETFQTKTQDEFERFLKKFHQKPTDLMHLVFNWLKCISLYWNIKLPDPVKDLYLDIFEIYTAHFDLSTWNQLTSKNFEASFRICVFFLEIDFELNDRWKNLFNHLIFNLGNCQIIEINLRHIFELRLVYLEYLCLNASGHYKQCLACLQQMSQIMSAYDEEPYVLHLPNLSNVCLDLDYIDRLKNDFQQQIDANRIPKLFESGEWQQLAEIIMKAIESSNNDYENEFWFKDFTVQVQILLQSFWNTCSYENCFIWSEKCLHYIIANLLAETRASRQKQLAELHNFVISYIEAIILNEGFHAVTHLSDDGLSRLVQNIISILVFYLDGIFEKNNIQGQELDFKRLWVVLHQILLRDENDCPNIFNVAANENEDANELIPKSFSILFTAHEFLGKRQWCSKDNGEFLQYILDAIALNLKAPIYDGCRDLLYEHIEQVTYCLFKYPQKKARSRHLEDHEATQVKLNWIRAVQVFDLYRPEKLPEFNSYKLESISSDMEQLLLKIISLMPQDLDLSESVEHITKFIEGQLESLPEEAKAFKWPYKINSIFYLLADFYFKSRDFFKAIKYYILDLAISPVRFDSWAGIALSKASKIETKLNGLCAISPVVLWEECEEVLRCFECCVNLNRYQALLWIEYGSFTYTIHSYFSRYLKHDSENLSMEKFSNVEEKKTRMLNIAFNCFSYATSLQNTTACPEENADANDEKWLCQYMLGKISEKRKEEPKVYLNHYLMAANYLYENNATYPIKLNHSNPTTLSVEALEVFYRINASIIKFLEHEKEVTRTNGDLFNKVLKNLSNSPFAYNKAKVDGSLVHNFKPPEERKQAVLPQESPNASRRESQVRTSN
uniref:Calcineurin-binding protein cabin-1 MEF2-binding domain-containing protein n=1 Tax=Glossina austeni TaxID=7395 RepID=A0A1A9VR67_GLOAU